MNGLFFHIDSNNHIRSTSFSSNFSIPSPGRHAGDGRDRRREQRDQRRGPWPRGEVYLGARRSAEAHRHGEVAWALRGFFLGNEGYPLVN